MATVLKLGGELLDDAAAMRAMADAIRTLSSSSPVVVVHGGGRRIDGELRVRGIEPRFVDGLRVTDAATLETVVSVLAGRTNTAFVATLHAAGLRAVGLTGADGGIGRSLRAPVFTTTKGAQVDLGLVGQPADGPVTLLQDLLALGYVPVVASIGVDDEGALLNVNADTLAGYLAGALQAERLVIAGATAGVLDEQGETLPSLTLEQIDAMIASGTAHSGMVAKLAACRHALAAGAGSVAVVTGRGVTDFSTAPGTRILAGAAETNPARMG